MPGANCAFPECTVSRTAKYQGIGIFQIPMKDDDFHVNWRNNIAAVYFFYCRGTELWTKLSENVYLLERFTYINDIVNLKI